MASKLVNKTTVSETLYTGGKTDAKGRVEGLRVQEWEATYADLELSDTAGGYCHAPGQYFVVCMTKTKNGKPFGASQPRQHFKTPEERHAAVTKRLKKVL